MKKENHNLQWRRWISRFEAEKGGEQGVSRTQSPEQVYVSLEDGVCDPERIAYIQRPEK
jgi:hypothetical protein